MAKKNAKKKKAKAKTNSEILAELVEKEGVCWVLTRIQEGAQARVDDAQDQIGSMQDEVGTWEEVVERISEAISEASDC